MSIETNYFSFILVVLFWFVLLFSVRIMLSVSFPLEPRGIVAEVPPVADEARRGWRSGQNPSALQAGKGFWEPQEDVTFVPGDTTHPSAYGIHLP